uniref:Uncharacterized protein n=1 Tax=Plectus sambesii TaxID=2011161 RepID=A0A914V7E5_9BILA
APPHADFWQRHSERAKFLFLEQARAEPSHQLQYIGHQLVPNASVNVQKLLDCLFIKNKQYRPRSEDVLNVFEENPSASTTLVCINAAKLDELQRRINEEEKYYNAYKALG